ncbi:hypothetical protein JMG10_14660 [Nostoc ellipsosporum NOK]|nr:hypothetical protein [Nostoc ellipsosporum NOK]
MQRTRLIILVLLLLSKMEASGTDSLFRTIRHFTNADGLPQNSVKAIGRDTAGFIWMATESGLTRFDGANFQTFTSRQYALHSNRFTAILSWPGVRGLFAFTDLKEMLPVAGGKPVKDWPFLPPSWRPSSLQRLPDGLLNRHVGLRVADNNVWQSGDSLLFPVSTEKIYIADPANCALYDHGRRLFSIAYKATIHERLFLLDEQLFAFDIKTGSFCHFSETGVRRLYVEGLPATNATPLRLLVNTLQPEYAVVGLGHSLYMLRFKDKKLRATKIADNFDSEKEEIMSVWFDDSSQKLLLGSSTKGLFILARPAFQSSAIPSATTNQVYYAQALSSSKTVVIGQGLIFEPPAAAPVSSWPSLQQVSDKYSLITDAEGFLWTKRDSNVFRLSVSSPSPVSKWSFARSVVQITTGIGNTIWVSLVDSSVNLISPADSRISRLCRLPAQATFMLQEDENNAWLGTTGGLYHFDIRDRQYRLWPASRGWHIRSMYLDKDKRLWVTTYGQGFFLVEKDKCISFPTDVKEYLLNAHCILEDNHGFFWITTNNGLFQAAKADLLAYAKQPSFEPYYHYYNEDDGLPTNEFNGGCNSCGLILPDGWFSFPSMDGLVWFDPRSSKSVMPDRAVYIDKILLDNREIPFSDVIDLPLTMQQLKLEINTPFLGNRENIRLQYTLYREYEQPVWLPVDNDIISFATLPSGNYILEIRKVDGFGPGNYTSRRLHLHVPRPWYLYPASLILFALLIVTGGFVLYLFRTRYIRRRNILLESKVAEQTNHLQQTLANLTQSQHELVQQLEWQQKMLAVLSHDIKAPLKYLMLATDRIRQGIINDNITAYQEPTKTVYEYSRRLYYTMDNLLQYVKTQLTGDSVEKKDVDLHSLVENKRLIFEDIAKGSETIIDNRIPKGFYVFTNQTLLAIILHNLIDNAVKVTERGAIILDAVVGEDGTMIYVKDTGIGMPQQINQWINYGSADDSPLAGTNPSGSGIGLYIVKGLASLLEINISVYSNDGGTAFHLFLGKSRS